MKISISFLTGILLSISCASSPRLQPTSIDFPETRELDGRTLQLDTALLRYPFRIQVKGNKVVLFDLHGVDYYFHLFSYPEFRYLSSFGQRGEAPKEILSAENFRWLGDSLWTLDSGKAELVCWLPQGDSVHRVRSISMKRKVPRPYDFVQCTDETFLVPDYSGQGRFCRIAPDGSLMHRIGTIPAANRHQLAQRPVTYAYLWRSFVDYNSNKDVLVTATQMGEVLEIFHLKDTLRYAIYVGAQSEPYYLRKDDKGFMGFSDVQVTDRAIYAVFHGHTFKEIMRSRERGEVHPDGGKYIYVFSLDGKPLRKYVLDHYVYGISVDETQGIILATDVNQDEPIIEFSMT